MRAFLLALALGAAPAALARESKLPLDNRLSPVSRPAQWGLGITLGEPFGLSLKRYLGGANAWDFNVGLAYGPGFRLGADYLWGLGTLVRRPKVELDLYAGAGPFFGTFRGGCGPGYFGDRCNGGDAYLGGRVPVGVELLLKELPMSAGLELAPALFVGSNGPGFLLDLLFAFRYLFV
jgi:hypothetical protein